MGGKKKYRPPGRSEFAVNTIIGPDSLVRGDLETGGFTRVDGDVRGNLHAGGRVVVGPRARMRSNISGTSVTVGGVVDGNILASERLTVLASGLILGDVITRRIEAHEGCLIHGRIRVIETGGDWERAAREHRDKRRGAAAAGQAGGGRAESSPRGGGRSAGESRREGNRG